MRSHYCCFVMDRGANRVHTGKRAVSRTSPWQAFFSLLQKNNFFLAVIMPALLLAGLHGCATQMQVGDQNALVTAATVGDNIKVAKMLGQGVDANIQLNDGTTALFMAAQQGHTDTVTLLLNADANINVQGYRGATPLLIAATTGHTDIVDLLIKRGATVDIPREDHATPLFMAAQGGYVNVVNLLVDAGAYPDKLAYKGATALFIAAQNGHHPVVQALAARGADVNLGLEDGTTPLLAAALKGHMSVSRVLLEHGARPDTANQRGMTPMLAARQEGHPELSALLGRALASPALADTKTGPAPEIRSAPVVEETTGAVAAVSSGQPVPADSAETRVVAEARQITDTNTDAASTATTASSASTATTAAASTTGTTPQVAAVKTQESHAGTDQPASSPMQAATVTTVSGVPASKDNDNTAPVPAPVTERVTDSTAGTGKKVAPSTAASWRPETPASQVAGVTAQKDSQATGKPTAPEPTTVAQQADGRKAGDGPQAAPATAASWQPETPASQLAADDAVPEVKQAAGKPAAPEPTTVAQQASVVKSADRPTTASATVATRPAEKPVRQAAGKTMPDTPQPAPGKIAIAGKPATVEKIVYLNPKPPETVKTGERTEREAATVGAAPATANKPVQEKRDDAPAVVRKPAIKTPPVEPAQEKSGAQTVAAVKQPVGVEKAGATAAIDTLLPPANKKPASRQESPASMDNTIATAERADEDNTGPVSSAASKRSNDSPVASKTETIVANVDKNKDKPRTEPVQAPDLAATGTEKTRLAAIELESDDLQVRATTSRKILRKETTPAETVKKVIKGLDEDEESGLADTGAATIQKQFTRKNFDANKHVKQEVVLRSFEIW